jgi:hypothetical protein
MYLLSWISLLVFSLVVCAKESPTELQVDTTYKPTDCPATAKTGDSIKVHYVSSLIRSSWFLVINIITQDRQALLKRKQVRFKVR